MNVMLICEYPRPLPYRVMHLHRFMQLPDLESGQYLYSFVLVFRHTLHISLIDITIFHVAILFDLPCAVFSWALYPVAYTHLYCCQIYI